MLTLHSLQKHTELKVFASLSIILLLQKSYYLFKKLDCLLSPVVQGLLAISTSKAIVCVSPSLCKSMKLTRHLFSQMSLIF